MPAVASAWLPAKAVLERRPLPPQPPPFGAISTPAAACMIHTTFNNKFTAVATTALQLFAESMLVENTVQHKATWGPCQTTNQITEINPEQTDHLAQAGRAADEEHRGSDSGCEALQA